MNKIQVSVESILMTFLFTISVLGLKGENTNSSKIEVYTTTADKSMLFKRKLISFDSKPTTSSGTILLNPTIKYQEMDGFGAALTGSSCYNLLQMNKGDRSKLLNDIFDPKTGLGYSYIRISIGCSDFSLAEYTCCDKMGLENFEIHAYDQRDLLPILKEILAINPKVKIMGSPWTAPRWMKINNLEDLKAYNSWTSGQLNPQYYRDYATYFVKYVLAMQHEGILIESITVQNEPLNRGNSVSMFMTWQEQLNFIKNELGPQFKAANIKTKIILYDHNYDYDSTKVECKDQTDYPLHILNDPEAAQYISGTAWHAYSGDASELEKIHETYPEKGIFFTEMSIGEWSSPFAEDLMWSMKEVGLGTINRNCKAVIVWNLMLDEKNGPDRLGGCNTCYGSLRINSLSYKPETIDRLSHYYVIGHLSKVVLPGAFRIETTNNLNKKEIYYSAFLNPDNSYSVIVENDSSEEQQISISSGSQFFTVSFLPKSINSIKWRN